MRTTVRDPISAIGIEIHTSNDHPDEIGACWQRFIEGELASQIPMRESDEIIACYCDYEGDHTEPYTFFLGCEVGPEAAAPSGMRKRRIPGGSFAQFSATGPMPEALMVMWQSIWEAPLDRVYVADYEIHDGSGAVDVFVGVE